MATTTLPVETSGNLSLEFYPLIVRLNKTLVDMQTLLISFKELTTRILRIGQITTRTLTASLKTVSFPRTFRLRISLKAIPILARGPT